MIDPVTLAELTDAIERHKMIMEPEDDLTDIVTHGIAMGDNDRRGLRGYYIGAAAAILARIDTANKRE